MSPVCTAKAIAKIMDSLPDTLATDTAKAVKQPPLSRKAKHPTRPRPTHCLNCGHPTDDNFCPHCGQENEDETVTLKLLVTDFLSDLASFDSRLFRTLIPLVVRPGFLTNEYNVGRRVRYLSPFKLYITMSVLFFVLLPLTHHGSLIHIGDRKTAAQSSDPKTIKETNVQIKEANTELKDVGLHVNIAAPHANSAKILTLDNQDYDLSHLPKTVEEYNARQRDPRYTHDSRAMQYLFRQIIKVRQSPQALSQALLDYIPKMMFLLLPGFALSLKLVYLRSRRLYIEHLIFALHLHAFIFLLLSLTLLIHSSPFYCAVALILLLYPMIAMRVVYKQGWIKTFIKYNLLACNYLFLLTFALLGAAAVAFLLM